MALMQAGQAAITDALYFLTIVAALCIFLFIFATQYGNSVDSSINDRYLEEFEASALKTILYSSTPRHIGQDLTAREIDYLLSAVKEDFADDQALDETQMRLLKDINAIMRSKSDSFDYIFYIYSTEFPTNRFPYFLYYKSEWEESKLPRGYKFVSVTPKGHRFFFCHPERLSQIDNMLLGVAGIPPTRNRIKLMRIEQLSSPDAVGYETKAFTSEAFLKMWPSTQVDAAAFLQLKCCEAGTANCNAGNQPSAPAGTAGAP